MTQIPEIPNHKVLAAIGLGNQGEVYKTRCLKTKALCACKVYFPGKGTGYEEEIEFQRTLSDHPTMVAFLGEMHANGRHIMVTEYFRGANLYNTILNPASTRFDQNEIFDIAKQLFFGLEFIHSFGIAHRDIKLENLLIRRSDSLELKIIDFGNAVDGQMWGRAGTVVYCPPEFIPPLDYDRDNLEDPRLFPLEAHQHADLFAAGLVLTELVCWIPSEGPFTNKQIWDLIYDRNAIVFPQVDLLAFHHSDLLGVAATSLSSHPPSRKLAYKFLE